MCSIAGIYGYDVPDGERQAFAAAALIAGEPRGTQSGGVLSGKVFVRTTKRPRDLAAEIGALDPADFAGPCTLVHTRTASCGQVTEANAHPIPLSDGSYVTHNGHIPKEIDIPGWKYTSATDSERLASWILSRGIEATSGALGGYASVAVWTPPVSRKPGRLILWRAGGPLAWCRIHDHAIAWASTPGQLKEGLEAAGRPTSAMRIVPDSYAILIEGRSLKQTWKNVGLHGGGQVDAATLDTVFGAGASQKCGR